VSGRGLSSLLLLADTARAHEQLAQADAYATEDTVQARKLLAEAAPLKSGPFFRVVSQRIEREQRLLIERNQANEKVKQLQQKPEKTAAEQRELLELLERLRVSRLVTQAQVEAQHGRVATLDQFASQLKDTSQLDALWMRRAEVAGVALDLGADLAEQASQRLSAELSAWLTTGPITSTAAQAYLQRFDELAQFGPVAQVLRQQAQQERADLRRLVQAFESVSTGEAPSNMTLRTVSPLLVDFSAVLQDAVKRRTTILQCANTQAPGDLARAAETIVTASAPTAGTFAKAFSTIDQGIRQLAIGTLAEQIGAASVSPESDPATIEPALSRLTTLDVARANALRGQFEQQQKERLHASVRQLSQQLDQQDWRLAKLEGEVRHLRGLDSQRPRRLSPLVLWLLVGLLAATVLGLLGLIGFRTFAGSQPVGTATPVVGGSLGTPLAGTATPPPTFTSVATPPVATASPATSSPEVTAIPVAATAALTVSEMLTVTTSIGVYTTTVNATGLGQRTITEVASRDGNGVVVLTAGDQVEILELQSDRYRVRVLSNQFDGQAVVGSEGWVRRVLIDGPVT